MKSIVVGFDEGEESDDALAFGRALAEAEEATLKVAVALDYAPVPIEVEAHDRALAEHFDEIFARAERQLGGVEFERLELRDSSPARALTELAEADDSSLIVIGSTHRGALGRVYPGSVGERLVNGAPCPVAIAPRGFARKEQFDLGLIGVGYDGTEESRLALREAADLAKQRGANLRLIAAVPYVDPHSEQDVQQGEQLSAAPPDCRVTDSARHELSRGVVCGATDQAASARHASPSPERPRPRFRAPEAVRSTGPSAPRAAQPGTCPRPFAAATTGSRDS